MAENCVVIASDHGGFELKNFLADKLAEKGIEVINLGVDDNTSVDYPDQADKLAAEIAKHGENAKGVLVCGTGIGVSIAANRHKHLRAALIYDAYGARLCREHNNANVIVFGGRTIGTEVAADCLDVFLNTDFQGGRHARRVGKMS